MAETPEESTHTSVFDRIRSMVSTTTPSTPSDQPEPAALAAHEPACERPPAQPQRPDAWLCELTIQDGPCQTAAPSPAADPEPDFPAPSDAPATPAPSSRVSTDHTARASNQGFLPMSVSAYLSLVDWTGRQIREGSRGTIPAELAPILDRLKLNGDSWIETVRFYGRWFKQVVGGLTAMKKFAGQIGRGWFHGQRQPRSPFFADAGSTGASPSAHSSGFRDGHRNRLTAWLVSELAKDPRTRGATNPLPAVACIERVIAPRPRRLSNPAARRSLAKPDSAAASDRLQTERNVSRGSVVRLLRATGSQGWPASRIRRPEKGGCLLYMPGVRRLS